MYAFKEGYAAERGRLNYEWGMTAGLKDNLAWFHRLYVQRLSYLKVLSLKKKRKNIQGNTN